MKKQNALKLFFGSLTIISVFLLVFYFARPQASGEFKIYFLDVGQGDAEYFKTPSGADILIDGGPDGTILNELGKVMDFGDRKIDLVILSHPHADHLTGLLEVIKRYEVGEVWQTGVEYPSATYDAWQNEIINKNISQKFVSAGTMKDFAETKIFVLSPLSPLQNSKIDNLNNSSIVNRVEYKNFSGLFTGDAEIGVQKQLLTSGQEKNLFSTILKVSHHGSENGLSEDFLKVVRPAVAVISVGKDNTYGHPAQSTINLLESYAIRVFRTDQNGTIEISSDGEGYVVNKK